MCRKHFRAPIILRNVSTQTKMWIAIAVLALLSPIGILLPDRLKAGSAWGEWGIDEIEKMLGYVPQGMKKVAETWRAPLPDYDLKGWDQMGMGMQSVGYIFSAIIGIVLVVAVVMFLGKMTVKDE